MSKKLSDLFAQHGSDKWTGQPAPHGHSYGPFYDELLTPIKDTVFTVLELGVLNGASLRAFRDFFPNAFVIGLDNTREPFEEWQISCRSVDVTKADQVDAALGTRVFDLIIDDASHWEQDQIKSFEILKSRLRSGALYVIEDIQCQTSHGKFTALGFELHDFRGLRGKWDDLIMLYRHPA